MIDEELLTETNSIHSPLYIGRLDAFSRPKMLFGEVNKNKVEVHFKGTKQFLTRSEAFTLLKLFLYLESEKQKEELHRLEQKAVLVRDHMVRVEDLLAQLPHKQLGDGFKLLARIVNNDTKKPDWAI